MSQQISKGHNFVDGDIVTAQNLNNLTDGASFVSGAGNTTDNSSLEVHQDGYLKIKDGGVQASHLASDALSNPSDPIIINNNNFTDNTIDGDKIVNNSITTTQIADGAITQAKIASGVTFPPSTHTHSNATQSYAGFMSSADKTKLDGISSGGGSSGGGTTINSSGEVAIGNNVTPETNYTATIGKNLYIAVQNYNTGATDKSLYAIEVSNDIREWPDGTDLRGLYTSTGGTPSKTIGGVSYAPNNFAYLKHAVYSYHPTINDFNGDPGTVQHEVFNRWNRYTGGNTFESLEYTMEVKKIVGAWPPFFYDNGLKFRFQNYQDTSNVNIFWAPSVIPNQSAICTFGSPQTRWGRIFTDYAVDTSSDQSKKQDIEDISEAEKRVGVRAKALVKKYRYKIAVESKGDNAKTHFGIIAQDLKQAFIDEGLDPFKYGVLKKYTVWVGEKENGAPRTEEAEFEGGVETEELSVRYDELWALIISSI